MRIKKYVCTILIGLSIVSISGCFKEIVDTRESMPNIIWPRPPEIPRIRFVNAISKPGHLNIRETFSEKLLSFIKGRVEASLVNPYGVITDHDERLYIVDNFSRRIHVFDKKNNDYYLFPEGTTRFVSPIDIAIDSNGLIYVSDSKEGAVFVFKEHGKQFVKLIGKGLLNRPTGLAFNKKTAELLVVDTKNSEILRYDIENHTVKGIIGREGIHGGFFHNPTNIFTTPDGRIYISDSLNFRIQIFGADGNFIRAFGTPGNSPGNFARPRGVAVDSENNIYVVDALFDNVQIFNENGELLMDFGNPGSMYGEFWLPSGIYIDANDMIYISDSYNKRIQVFQYIKESDPLHP